jgi:cobalt/nickel transport system ATP-binding protein
VSLTQPENGTGSAGATGPMRMMQTTDLGNSVPAIRVSGLEYRYPDGKEALRGIDLTVQAGESVAIVGPNGAGKSTLLLHLNGLLPGKARGTIGHAHILGGELGAGASHRPSAPRVWIDGVAVSHRNAAEVRRRVGLVFQDPDDQLFCNTVIEDVAFGPLNQGIRPAEARRIALECLAQVDLQAEAERLPHHLSFGERKRACLAGVLACRPSVLVLDEPSANLDPRGRRRLIALIQGLSDTKLIATHDLELVLELCPRTVLLDAGRVVADDPSRTVLGNAELMEVHGLEQPLSLRFESCRDPGIPARRLPSEPPLNS